MVIAHLGESIARLRGLRRLTQKQMADKLNLAQSEYSRIEQKAEIDDNLLMLIASALEVSPEAIKNFDENAIIQNISCNFSENAVNTIYQFNPVDKIIALYETIIKQKDETIEILKSQLKSS